MNTWRGGRLEIEMAGETLSCAIDRVAGDPGSPMSREAVVAKFCRYAAGALGEQRAREAAAAAPKPAAPAKVVPAVSGLDTALALAAAILGLAAVGITAYLAFILNVE